MEHCWRSCDRICDPTVSMQCQPVESKTPSNLQLTISMCHTKSASDLSRRGSCKGVEPSGEVEIPNTWLAQREPMVRPVAKVDRSVCFEFRKCQSADRSSIAVACNSDVVIDVIPNEIGPDQVHHGIAASRPCWKS